MFRAVGADGRLCFTTHWSLCTFRAVGAAGRMLVSIIRAPCLFRAGCAARRNSVTYVDAGFRAVGAAGGKSMLWGNPIAFRAWCAADWL